MANNTAPLILNPLTPMAYLPPDFAFDFTLLKYVFVGTLGAVIWDGIMCIGVDYHLLRDHKITIPTSVYFLSRAITLVYFILGAILTTAPVGNCSRVLAATMWLFALAVPTTSLLFFFRVRAVYLNNKYVVCAFAVMWLGVLGGCISATQAATAARIEPTNYCLSMGSGPSISAAAVIPLINDVLGFCAVTWRLTKNSQVNPTFKSGLKAMVFGHYLPAFSKALLQDGQIYFLSTIGIYILTVIMLYIKGLPPVYSSLLGNPNVAIMNAMACRMYRNTKLGLYRLPALSAQTSEATSSKSIAFQVDYSRNDSRIDNGGIKLQELKVQEDNRFNGPSEKATTMV